MTNNVSFLSLFVLNLKVNFDDALIVLKLSEIGHIKKIVTDTTTHRQITSVYHQTTIHLFK